MSIRLIKRADFVWEDEGILNMDNTFVVEEEKEIKGYFELKECEDLLGDTLNGKVLDTLKKHTVGESKCLGYICSFETGYGKKMLDYIFNTLKVENILLETSKINLKYWLKNKAEILEGCNCTFRDDFYRMYISKENYLNGGK